jgi:hypothetical protein
MSRQEQDISPFPLAEIMESSCNLDQRIFSRAAYRLKTRNQLFHRHAGAAVLESPQELRVPQTNGGPNAWKLRRLVLSVFREWQTRTELAIFSETEALCVTGKINSYRGVPEMELLYPGN